MSGLVWRHPTVCVWVSPGRSGWWKAFAFGIAIGSQATTQDRGAVLPRSDTLLGVTGRDEWNELITRIRADSDPLRSPHLREFYAVAVRDGMRLLASFRRSLGDERLLDLIHDVLADVDQILSAETPRAFFCTALQRRAISWRRRGDASVAETPPEEVGETGPHDEEARRAFMLDAIQALDALPDRDRRIAIAAGLGEDREAIAREHGLSRANVDQIISRARKRLGRGGA
jgi:RNA polymerase sigma factor (sigma-70 family)